MKIGFIGAGKVAAAFGCYLVKKGFILSGYYSRTTDSAQAAAQLTKSCCYDEQSKLLEDTDIVFITTTDDQIENACKELASKSSLNSGHIIVHMSGALSSSILESVREKGCSVFSMHPLQSFADITAAVEELQNTYFAIEGDESKIHILESILKQTDNPYFKLSKENKALYHAAACSFSNYLVELVQEGLQLLKAVGIEPNQGFRAMLPLVMGTLRNISMLGTDAALTGPIARGDEKTIKNHLKEIQEIAPESYDFYKYMAVKTIELAKREKLKDENKIKALEQILFGGEKL